MNFEIPDNFKFTIYSKSNCIYCTKVKKLLIRENLPFIEYNCDTYLDNYKTEFLDFIKHLANTNHKTFPIVFNKGSYIGGYTETNNYLDKLNLFNYTSDF